MSTALQTLTSKLATKLEMGEGNDLVNTLKSTVFKGNVSDAQLTALLVVANQYGLNPWTKEIYAFPDKNNGIVPVVGVDGWSRIINDHAQFDGMEFEQDDETCTCIIHRKDRSHPIRVTEYMSECKRQGFGPWSSHPKRMLRHKALIQCARLAFGYTGIYDQDEAELIREKDITPQVPSSRREKNIKVAESSRPAANIQDDEKKFRLIEQLEDIASNQGIDAYSSLWQGLSKPERQMVGTEEHARLKEIAKQFGVIDADYKEVSA